MKLACIILFVVVGSSIAASGKECASALNSVAPIVSDIIKLKESKNEAQILAQISNVKKLFSQAVVVCDGVTGNIDFKTAIASGKNDVGCFNSLHDTAFLGEIMSSLAKNKEWSAFYDALEDFTTKGKKTMEKLCKF